MCSNFLPPLQLNSSAITYAFHPQLQDESTQMKETNAQYITIYSLEFIKLLFTY